MWGGGEKFEWRMPPEFTVWATGCRNDIMEMGKTLGFTDIFSCRKLGLKDTDSWIVNWFD